LNVTLFKCSDVPEILEVQVVESDDVRMVPDLPTATKGLFPQVIPLSLFDVPEVLEVQVIASDEVSMVPISPTVTNILFP